MNLKQKLLALRSVIANAAQKVVDEWQLDEEGLDPDLGAGGVCDLIASAIIEVIGQSDGIEATCGSPPGEDHEWVVVSDNNSAFIVDIPAIIYEIGAGYSWKKIEGAQITSQDVIIEPIDLELAQEILKESGQMRRLIALAEALEALGEVNNAALVRVLSSKNIFRKAQGWTSEFFKNNPEFLDRAEQFTSARGIDMSTYLNQLDALKEPVGRQKLHSDLGYKGMGSLWSPKPEQTQEPQQEPKKVQTPKFEPMKELQWEFPPPNVLKDKESFLASALAWAMGEGSSLYEQMYGSADEIHSSGRKGEIQAARAYLRYLMKDVAPKLAATLQAKWKIASETGDVEEQRTIKSWWSSLSDVWKLLQRMISIINSYESY